MGQKLTASRPGATSGGLRPTAAVLCLGNANLTDVSAGFSPLGRPNHAGAGQRPDQTHSKGQALFENQSPGFTAEFGDRKDPAQHKIRFEAAPNYNDYKSYNGYKDYSAEKPSAFQRQGVAPGSDS